MSISGARKKIKSGITYLKSLEGKLNELKALETMDGDKRYLLIENPGDMSYVGLVRENGRLHLSKKEDEDHPEKWCFVQVYFEPKKAAYFWSSDKPPKFHPRKVANNLSRWPVSEAVIDETSKLVIGEEPINAYLAARNSSFQDFIDVLNRANAEEKKVKMRLPIAV